MRRLLRYSPLALLLVLVITILAMSRYAETRNYDHANNARPSRPQAPVTPNEAAKSGDNADKAEHAPEWVQAFTWPEGVTVWALILTLMVIAWQSVETHASAEAARVAGQAALKQAELAEAAFQ